MKITHVLKVVLSGLALLGVLALSSQAFAATDIKNARIYKTGISPAFPGPMVQLIDESPNPVWSGPRQFYLSADLGDAGYATLLTAFALGQNVWVRIADDAAPASLVLIIFVNAP